MPTLPPAVSRLQRTLILAASATITAAVVVANFGLAQSYGQAQLRSQQAAARASRQLATTPRNCAAPFVHSEHCGVRLHRRDNAAARLVGA